MHSAPNEYLFGALIVWSLALAVDDIRQRRVLNWAVFLVALLILVQRSLESLFGLQQALAPGFAGTVIGLAFWLPGYVLKQSGAGDVKFAMTIGLVLGPVRAIEANLLAM